MHHAFEINLKIGTDVCMGQIMTQSSSNQGIALDAYLPESVLSYDTCLGFYKLLIILIVSEYVCSSPGSMRIFAWHSYRTVTMFFQNVY